MSLINDALKRVTQAQGRRSASNPDASMEVVERHGSVGLPTYFMPVLLFVVAGACYFIVRGWDVNRHLGFYPEPVTVQAREASQPAAVKPVPAAEVTVAAEAPAPAPAQAPAAANRQFTVNEMVAPAETDPSFRLQGIFYRPSKPSAVVNSQTVYVGDAIGNGKVQAINRDSVTLLVNGQSRVLTLR